VLPLLLPPPLLLENSPGMAPSANDNGSFGLRAALGQEPLSF
jgi:hypothetical protein